MVELFVAGRLTRTPELVAPAALVTECGLPTRARLSEPIRPNPLDGIRFCNSLLQNPTRFGLQPPHAGNRASGALVSSLVVLQSMEVPRCETSNSFIFISVTHSPFSHSTRVDQLVAI